MAEALQDDLPQAHGEAEGCYLVIFNIYLVDYLIIWWGYLSIVTGLSHGVIYKQNPQI